VATGKHLWRIIIASCYCEGIVILSFAGVSPLAGHMACRHIIIKQCPFTWLAGVVPSNQPPKCAPSQHWKCRPGHPADVSKVVSK